MIARLCTHAVKGGQGTFECCDGHGDRKHGRYIGRIHSLTLNVKSVEIEFASDTLT
jgi:hypothetical protein